MRPEAHPHLQPHGPSSPLAAGNANGDIPVLQFTRHRDKPLLSLLLLHDDADREFDYTEGAEKALRQADSDSWTIVSMKNEWATVFPDTR